MNKIITLAVLIASTLLISNVEAASANKDLVVKQYKVPFDWMLEKNLVILSPEQRKMLDEEGIFQGDINIDFAAVAQNLAQDGNAYLATNNPEDAQKLATNLLRYFKLMLISARFNKGDETAINEVMSTVRPYLATHQDAILARARLNKHGDLVQLLSSK